MKLSIKYCLTVSLICWSLYCFSQTGAIHINQVGYYPTANKIAVIAFTKATSFEVINTRDQSVELTGDLSSETYWKDAGDSVKLADFSALTKTGTYKIRIPNFGESYSFEISNTVLRKAAYASLKSFYYQRCSYELKPEYAGIWARPAGHPDTNCKLHSSTGKSGSVASPGGWYDAGDFGKYVINAGISVGTMLSFYENFNTFFADGSIHIPESGNGQNDLLDEVKFELDWLKTMQDDDGGVFFKVTTLNFAGFVMPDKSTAQRYMIGKVTASALDFASMMAMAGRIYTEYDSAYAADCIDRAEKAWEWALANPKIYFKNPSDVSTGEYGDGNVSDEFLWAASELFITTQKEEYKTYLEGRSSSLSYWSAPGWPNVQQLGSLSLLTRPNGLSEKTLTSIKNSLISTADKWLGQIASSPCRIPQFGFNWGSNSGIGNMGVGLLYAYLVTNDQKYVKGAAECADYLLGKNATGFSFVTSFGARTPMNIHHRASGSDNIIQPVPGFVSGGPNSGKQDGQKYPFSDPAKCFVDVTDSYASNEVCINWNSPLTALLAGVDAVLGDGSEVAFEVPTEVNNPPSLMINTPGNDSKKGSDKELIVKCSANDADGIASVELYVDSHFEGVLFESPCQWTLNNLTFGDHTITIVATDTKGLSIGKTNTFNYYYVEPSGVQQLTEYANSLTVFPNVIDQSFTVKYKVISSSATEFILYDMNGKVVESKIPELSQSREGEFIWNIASEIPNGTYYLTLQQNGIRTATCKLLKQ